jgi:hypothetical protein
MAFTEHKAVCTKENPMTPERVGNEVRKWHHSGVEFVRVSRALVRVKCLWCGHTWVQHAAYRGGSENESRQSV